MQIVKIFSLPFFLILIVLHFSSCNTNFKKSKSGVEYKFLKKGDGRQVKENDFLKVHVIRYMGDSLFFDSHKSQPDIIQYRKDNSQQRFNLLEVLEMAKSGDSIALRVPLDSIFKDAPNKPPFYKKGAFARIFLTVLSVNSQEEQNKEMVSQKANLLKELTAKGSQDKTAIEAFATKNNLKGSFNAYGVFVAILKEGNGKTIATDTSVSLVYTGKLLNGTIFDSNADKVKKNKNALLTFKAGTGMLIPGFDYSLVGLKKGSHVRFIIPAALAYGERGAGEKIPANSILDFYLEIQ